MALDTSKVICHSPAKDVVMISSDKITRQLKDVGCSFHYWGKSEVSQLGSLLMEDEKIAMAVNGYYEGGFGLLVVTNFRVLVVDKKPFVLNLEDLRFDMITEVTYGARLFIATIHIAIPTRTIYFSSWSMDKLHKAMNCIQQQVMDAKNGGGNLPSDWFRDNVGGQRNPRTSLSISMIAKLARSAMKGTEQEFQTAPKIFHKSSNRAVNPFMKTPSFDRRRRYSVSDK